MDDIHSAFAHRTCDTLYATGHHVFPYRILPYRNHIIVGTILAGLVVLTQFPVYGAGSHGPMKWLTLRQFLGDLNNT